MCGVDIGYVDLELDTAHVDFVMSYAVADMTCTLAETARPKQRPPGQS